MLNWNQTLSYVKSKLSLPSTFIEDADEEMKTYLINTALREFSQYFPDVERTVVIPDNDNYKVDGKTNHYYFFDEEDLDIMGIVECYFSLENDVWSGHPISGPTSLNSYKWWALDVFKSKTFAKFSDFDKSYHYKPPNIVEVLDGNSYSGFSNPFVIEYERLQPSDLSKIPVAMSMIFMDLCLSHQMEKLGSLRSHYGDGRIQTPFGELPLNGEQLKSEGKELRREITERLIEESIPPVWIDIM